MNTQSFFKMPVFKNGDILDAKEDIIAHQCNCTTTGSLGLATDIFKRWPSANTYKTRKNPSQPGTVDAIQLSPDSTPPYYIVNMYAQFRPGKAVNEPRVKWFGLCLDQLQEALDGGPGADTAPITVAVPFRIGCGLAGGDWDVYLGMLVEFEQMYPGIQIVIYTK